MVSYEASNEVVAGRNVAFEAAKMGESVLAGQSAIITHEVATAGSSFDEVASED